MSEIQPFTSAERAQLLDNAEQGVSPTPPDVLRYEASFTMVDNALNEFHRELDFLDCTPARDDVSYASAAAPGSCLCALCSLHRISDQFIAALGQSVST